MSPREYPPSNYVKPPFPSISWQLRDLSDNHQWSLYYLRDIWQFTVIWTLLIYAVVHLGAAAIAMIIHGKRKSSWKYLWMVPVAYGTVAGVEALFAGSIVGLILGAVYNAGYFSMSTWVPLLWGIINVLVLIISSFSIQGGL